MSKKQLLEKIKALEERVAALEQQPRYTSTWPTVTWYDFQSGGVQYPQSWEAPYDPINNPPIDITCYDTVPQYTTLALS